MARTSCLIYPLKENNHYTYHSHSLISIRFCILLLREKEKDNLKRWRRVSEWIKEKEEDFTFITTSSSSFIIWGGFYFSCSFGGNSLENLGIRFCESLTCYGIDDWDMILDMYYVIGDNPWWYVVLISYNCCVVVVLVLCSCCEIVWWNYVVVVVSWCW